MTSRGVCDRPALSALIDALLVLDPREVLDSLTGGLPPVLNAALPPEVTREALDSLTGGLPLGGLPLLRTDPLADRPEDPCAFVRLPGLPALPALADSFLC